MPIRCAELGDWGPISYISRIAGYDDYINEMGVSYIANRDVYLYESEGVIKGFIKIENVFGKSQWLSGLRVHPDYRRSGIALELTDFALRKAEEDGLRTSRLLIEEHNAPSLNLSAKCGFTKRDCYYFLNGSPVPTGIEKDCMPVSGTVVDIGWKFAEIGEIPSNLIVFIESGEWVFMKFGDRYHAACAGTHDFSLAGKGETCVNHRHMTPGLMKYIMPEFPSACLFEKRIG